LVSVVAYDPATRAFTAEEPPAGTAEPELSIDALRLRVRQQELLADFGTAAVRPAPLKWDQNPKKPAPGKSIARIIKRPITEKGRHAIKP
jgi:hypothetical protein